MKITSPSIILLSVVIAPFVLCFSTNGLAADEASAKSLLKQSKCLTCHSVDKTKDGPSYKKVAEKYSGDASAVSKLYKHLTEPSMIDIDGEEEEHGIVKTRDDDKIHNLIAWILSR